MLVVTILTMEDKMDEASRIQELKDKFDRGKISQDDISPEDQEKVFKLYVQEIADINEDIGRLHEREEALDKGIEALTKAIKERQAEQGNADTTELES